MGRPALWASIRDQLEADVGRGIYQESQKLPTEAELSRKFGVNRHTVRRAIADLISRDILYARRGSGVFVTQTPTVYPLGERVRFHQSLSASGRMPTKEFLSREVRVATQKELSALEIKEGELVAACEGLSLADRQPVALFRSVFPIERVPTILGKFELTSSITEALRLEGILDYTRAWTRINAKIATPTLAAQLRVPNGSPILRTTSLNVDIDGRPIEFGRTWFAADRVTLTVERDG